MGKNIYNLLELVKVRPGMYIGSNTIDDLWKMTCGYFTALGYKGIDHWEYDSFWFFHEFIRKKYGFYESTSGWCNMILKQTNLDQKKALELFFKDFEEFKNTELLFEDLQDIIQGKKCNVDNIIEYKKISFDIEEDFIDKFFFNPSIEDKLEKLKGIPYNQNNLKYLFNILETYPDHSIKNTKKLVSFLENYIGNGFEEQLFKSLDRKIVFHNLSMLNRLKNISNDDLLEKCNNKLIEISKNKSLDIKLINLANKFLD